MKRKLILLLLLLTCWHVTLFAEKVYRPSTNGSPTSLDPVRSNTQYANLIVTSVFDTLYEYKYLKSPFELKPNLAVALPKVSPDGLTYTIDIKKGVVFQDDAAFSGGKGREVVASDVVYSFKRHFDKKNKSRGSWLWRGRIVGLDDWGKDGADYQKEIEGLKAIGKYRLQIKLIKPFPQLTYTLAMGFVGVMAEEVVNKYGKEIGLHPVGSGPFVLTSFNTQKAVLVKNPNYRVDIMDLEGYVEEIHGKYGVKALAGKRLPIVDKVEFYFVKEAVARWNTLTKGDEIQLGSLLLEMENKVLASKDPVTLLPEWAEKYHYISETEPGFVYNNFNMDNPEIGYNPDPKRNEANRLLRCAIRKGFNWNERIKRFYRGLGKAFPGVVLRNTDGWDDSLSEDSIIYDPEEAKRLLAKGGWNKSNLPVLKYNTTSSARMKQFFEQFRGWMKKIGYPTRKIKYVTYATFGDFSKVLSEKKGMFWGIGWGLDYPDAENTLQLWYGPNESPGSNAANYKNKEYDRLYELSSVMQPSPERTRIYKRMNQILINDCVNISGFSRTGISMWHKNVVQYYRANIIGSILKYVDVLEN